MSHHHHGPHHHAHAHPDRAHGHAHGHHHDHGHGLGLASAGLGWAFVAGILMNGAFVVAELVAGAWSGSTALVADATHNMGDVLGLALAGGAAWLARRPGSAQRTYGLRRSTVLAALINAVLLLLAIGGLSWEAVGRLRAPTPVQATMVSSVAALGVLVNGASALLFARAQKSDANVRAAFLHLLADAAISLGVVVAGLGIAWTGWLWLDPAMSLLVSTAIVMSAVNMLGDALHLALDGVPSNVKLAEVRTFLSSLPGVEEVHDLHVWALSTTQTALTAHLVARDGAHRPRLLAELERELAEKFAIEHVTVQVEPERCPRAGVC